MVLVGRSRQMILSQRKFVHGGTARLDVEKSLDEMTETRS